VKIAHDIHHSTSARRLEAAQILAAGELSTRYAGKVRPGASARVFSAKLRAAW